MQKAVYVVSDVITLLGISQSKAYEVINNLRSELDDQGILTLPGRVPKDYFHSRLGIKNVPN